MGLEVARVKPCSLVSRMEKKATYTWYSYYILYCTKKGKYIYGGTLFLEPNIVFLFLYEKKNGGGGAIKMCKKKPLKNPDKNEFREF